MSLHNLALMNIATGGSGPIRLAGAATVSGVPYLTFTQAGAVDGETISYSINDVNGSEVGTAVWTAATKTMVRTVVNSTNGGSPINVSAAALVAITPLASDILTLANPTASLGLTAINGTATTAMRSDAAPALNQAITPTWTGSHNFTPATGSALRFTVANGQLGINGAQTITSSVGAAARNYNLINITSDDAPIGAGSFGVGFNVQWTGGGTNFAGNRAGAQFALQMNVASNNDGDYVGANFLAGAIVSSGGTNTGAGAKGSFFGFNAFGSLLIAATNYELVSGGEVDIAIGAGSSAKHKTGLQIIEHVLDQIDAATTNAGLLFSAQSTAIGLQDGILFSTIAGQGILKTGGTILRADAAQSITNGIDLTNFTISGSAFKSTGFSIDGAGAITGTIFKSSTAPTAVSGAGPIAIGSASTIGHRLKMTLNSIDYWIPASTSAF